jgi:GAF domain-containing protein
LAAESPPSTAVQHQRVGCREVPGTFGLVVVALSGYCWSVTLRERFDRALSAGLGERTSTSPDLLPVVLCRATVAVLPVEGAGLSLTGDLRVPLGSSDDLAARGERLQVTLGEGPCLTAAALGQPLVADMKRMTTAWPLFAEEFLGQTPYRSVASVPLTDDGSTFGALDLYSTRTETLDEVVLVELAAQVADPGDCCTSR